MAPNHYFRKSLTPRPCDSLNNIVSGFNNFVKEYLRGKDSACGSDGKESAWNAGDMGSIPGWGRSPGEGNWYPLQYSCQENPQGQRSLAGSIQSMVSQSQTRLRTKHSMANTLHRRLQGSRHGASCRWRKRGQVMPTQTCKRLSQWRMGFVTACWTGMTLKRCWRIRGRLAPPPGEADTAAQRRILRD